MTPVLGRQDTHIDTMHVRGAGKNSPALRLRLTSLLSAADFRPEGTPPSSIIVVRRFVDPMPGHVSAGRVHVSRAWERAVRRQLGAWYRTAARPSRGVISPGADAVVFADESEMMACLALDLAKGDAGGRWWWQAVLRSLPAGSPSDRIGALLSGQPRAAPAALEHLTRWNDAAPVLEILTEGDALQILRAVCDAFTMADLFAEVTQMVAWPPYVKGRTEKQATADQPPRRRLRPAPVAPYVVLAGIGPSRQALMSVALTLKRNPSLVRRRDFLQALRTRIIEDSARTSREDATTSALGADPISDPDRFLAVDSSAMDSPLYAEMEPRRIARTRKVESGVRFDGKNREKRFPTAEASAESGSAGVTPLQSISERPSHTASPFADVPLPGDSSGIRVAVANNALHTPPHAQDAGSPATMRRNHRSGPADQNPTNLSDGADALTQDDDEMIEGPLAPAEKAAEPAEDTGILTQLGGVFYLINLMMHLDIPACFDASSGLRKVSGWSMLELLARALLASEGRDLARDPLWECLAVLDGRARDTLPGIMVQRGRRYVIPPPWLILPENPSPCRWAARDGRLRVWSDAGFLIIDIPSSKGPPAEQARRTIRELGLPDVRLSRRAFHAAPVEVLTGPLVQGLNPALLRWAGFVMPYLRYRLCKALAHPSIERMQMTDRLLVQEARLFITSSHVDLVVPLESISIPVRRAGLDRDPGWWPLLGRVVYFHFE